MSVGEKCRTGCRERNHRSYAECLRSAGVGVNLSVTPNNPWDKDVDRYKAARAEGIQPDGTSRRAVEEAVAFSDRFGTAYDGGDKESTLVRAGLAPEGIVT